MTPAHGAGRGAAADVPAVVPHRPTVDRPETLRQARRFEVHKGEYLHLGLCHPCAGQGAYGRQLGFRSVHPPCPGCLLLLTALPVAAPNGWRRFAKDSASVLSLTAEPLPVSSDPMAVERSTKSAERAA